MSAPEQSRETKDLNKWRQEIEDYLDELEAAVPTMESVVDDARAHIDAAFQSIDGPLRVVNAGLLNAGKSTLFNALADEEELFATADARKTTQRQEESVGPFVFIDTPGLDARRRDGERAKLLFRESQIILFVHSVVQGELERDEVEFLKELQNLFPDDALRHKAVIPVITKAANTDNLERISAKIRKQWTTAMGAAPKALFCVRAKTHLKGLREDKAPLCEYSQIPSLRTHLEGLVDDLREASQDLVYQRVDGVIADLVERLDEKLRTMHIRRQTQQEKINRRVQEMNEDIQDFTTRHRQAYQRANDQ